MNGSEHSSALGGWLWCKLIYWRQGYLGVCDQEGVLWSLCCAQVGGQSLAPWAALSILTCVRISPGEKSCSQTAGLHLRASHSGGGCGPYRAVIKPATPTLSCQSRLLLNEAPPASSPVGMVEAATERGPTGIISRRDGGESRSQPQEQSGLWGCSQKQRKVSYFMEFIQHSTLTI